MEEHLSASKSNDPLLHNSASTSESPAPIFTLTPSNENQPASTSTVIKKKRPMFTGSHIKFRLGAGDMANSSPDNLDVLQDLLTHQSTPSPTNIAVTPAVAELRKQPERVNSASSISESSACSFEQQSLRKLASGIKPPDQVLVELYDLKLEDERFISGSWDETARWIKYEEDVEGVDHHWGLPHVSFLSFHALLQLRKCIAKGTVLLDVPGHSADFNALTELIASAVAAEGHNEFGSSTQQNAMRRITQILQLRHKHVRHGGRRMSKISTAASSLVHLLDRGTDRRQQHDDAKPQRSISAAPLNMSQSKSALSMRKLTLDSGEAQHRGRSKANSPETIAEVDECTIESPNNTVHRDQTTDKRLLQPRLSTPNVHFDANTSISKFKDLANNSTEENRSKAKVSSSGLETPSGWSNNSFSKRHWRKKAAALAEQQRKNSAEINTSGNGESHPADSELVHVLVGELRGMRKIRFVMVRLAEPVPMPELTEDAPLRMMFVILGPALSDGSYHELGRSLATLLANKHFKTIAYGARDRCQLIQGLDSFLDGSVVIPPGEIDSKRLISGDELKKALRRRKREMNRQKVAAAEKNRLQITLDQATESHRQADDHTKKCKSSPAALSPPNGHGPADKKRVLTDDDQQRRQREEGSSSSSRDGSSAAVNIDATADVKKVEDNSGDGGKKWCQCPLFVGLRADIRNRIPLYWSDIKDAANFQCLTSVVFMFFASFVPAISFGGLMGKYTNETMGTIETLLAQCICGILWGLFSAQPLLIMSATGPVLIFEASLYTFCESLQLDFHTVRFYAGLFIMMIATFMTALDGAKLLIFVTRFTEDIFATLISAIFIAESLGFVLQTFVENPVEDYVFYERIHSSCGEHQHRGQKEQLRNASNIHTNVVAAFIPFDIERLGSNNNSTAARNANSSAAEELNRRMMAALASSVRRPSCGEAEPNTALLTAIIVFTTFLLAFLLKKLRESFYLGKHLRRLIGDFGVLIAITFVAVIVHLCIPDTYLARLDMPDHISFTNPEKRGHGLMVNPKLGIDQWHGIFVALIAALLVFILLFVETEITELLLSRKERGCKKGNGMHWDLVLMGLCAFLCSIFGLPWMCAAAVQSLAHCSSLTVMKKTVPGARQEVDHVIEQRITTIGVAVLIGLIAFGGSYLRLPLASLFGVFLYLGVMNLCGVHLIQRIVLFFIPEKYFPDNSYTSQMSIWRMHLYTWIQLICLFLVYAVKYFKKTALAFPFVLMMFIFVRHIILPRIFTERELKAIDGEEHSDDEEWSEKDDYESARSPV